jgi:hypothetical protein
MTETQTAKLRLFSNSVAVGKRDKKIYHFVSNEKKMDFLCLLENNEIECYGLLTWPVRGKDRLITPIKINSTAEDHR